MGWRLCEPLKLTVRYVQLGGQMLSPFALTPPNGAPHPVEATVFYNAICILFFFIINKLMQHFLYSQIRKHVDF